MGVLLRFLGGKIGSPSAPKKKSGAAQQPQEWAALRSAVELEEPRLQDVLVTRPDAEKPFPAPPQKKQKEKKKERRGDAGVTRGCVFPSFLFCVLFFPRFFFLGGGFPTFWGGFKGKPEDKPERGRQTLGSRLCLMHKPSIAEPRFQCNADHRFFAELVIRWRFLIHAGFVNPADSHQIVSLLR